MKDSFEKNSNFQSQKPSYCKEEYSDLFFLTKLMIQNINSYYESKDFEKSDETVESAGDAWKREDQKSCQCSS